MALVRVMLAAALVLLFTAGSGNAAKILAILTFPGKSHFFSFAPMLEELAKRGHQVTVVSPFPRATPLANYTDLVVKDTLHDDNTVEFNPFTLLSTNVVLLMNFLTELSIGMCEKVLQEPVIQELIHRKKLDYDLLIYEPFLNDCTYGFIHKMKDVPSIQVSSNTLTVWMGDAMGNPNMFSVVPEMMLGHTDHMTFMQRVANVFAGTYFLAHRYWCTVPKMEVLMRQYFEDPSMPGVRELETRASLLLLNSHPSVNYPRPLTPNTIEVGGMHIKPPKSLPQDLQKFMDEAPHGVVLFSLGSNAQSVDMPEHIRMAFVRTFSRLKQRVLWKWEADELPGQPANVRISKWLPQSDILAHPKLKAAILHGGLLSTQEAAYRGVPVVLLPIMADQTSNALRAQNMGYAVKLDLNNLSEETVSSALDKVLNDPSYAENAKRVSTIFRDQPQEPLERATFWVEFVLRQKGAPHLRSASLDLHLLQYMMIDVLAAIALVALVVTLLVVTLCIKVRRACSSRHSVRTSKKND